MKDAGAWLMLAYGNLLEALVYNGQSVKVYDLMAPSDAKAPYIILTGWQGRNDNTKTSFGQTGQFGLQVVTRFSAGSRSVKPAAEIIGLITALLKPEPDVEVLTVPGFSVWNTIVGETQDVIQPNPTDTVVRKIVTITHSLNQL